MTLLLLSARPSEDNQALWRAAITRGWEVVRARGIRVPEVVDDEVVIYVESLFAPAVAKAVGRKLLEVPEDWLVRLPLAWKRRRIELTTLAQARKVTQATFVKPPNDKSFAAQVYENGAELPVEFDDDMSVLLSEPVPWEGEYRCFCLDGKVVAVSPYYRSGEHAKLTNYEMSPVERTSVTKFAESVLAEAAPYTPKAVVIDVGEIVGQGLAVVEANAAWGSGIYGCDPDAVLDVLRKAVVGADGAG